MPYKNAEKRKEKSRDAARNRRGKEADVFAELSSLVPVREDIVNAMDKASVMRLAISSLKLRTLMRKTKLEKQTDSDATLNREYMRAVGGYMLLLDERGNIMYVSDDVSKVLGLNQLDLLGASLFEFVHPCDHDELQDILCEKDAEEDCRSREHMFFLRHKCTLTSKGRNVNLKSASYKVIRYTGHHLSAGDQCGLVLIGESIPQPNNLELPIDSFSFMSQHSLDLRFTYCDDRIQDLMGYQVSEVMSVPLYEFHHAFDGESMEKSFKGLFSKGQMWSERYRLLAKGGGYVWAETQATVIHNNKTDKPQCIICLHHILSGVENPGVIMSQVQIKMEGGILRNEPSKIKRETRSSSCRKTAAAKMNKSVQPKATSRFNYVPKEEGPIMSTENIFAPRTKDMSAMPNESFLRQIAPSSGDSVVPLLDAEEEEVVNLLEDVLFQESGLDLRTGNMQNPGSIGHIPTNPNNPGGKNTAQQQQSMCPAPAKSMGFSQIPFATSLASLMMGENPDDVMDDAENEASSMVRASTQDVLSHVLNNQQNGSAGIPNLEHLADNPKRSASVDIKRLEKQVSSPYMDSEDVDMDMRAPYIPMSGEEDLIFSMVAPVPLIDEMDTVSNMLGTTESIFCPKPPAPDSEKEEEKVPVPMCILREQAMQKQEKELSGQKNEATLPRLNAPMETNQLETGPPPKKRARVCPEDSRDEFKRMDSTDDDDCFFINPPSCESNIPIDEITRGSMVLKNLLVDGQDPNHGYDIFNWNSKKENSANQQTPLSPSTTLRGLLTGPIENLSAPTSPTKTSAAVPLEVPNKGSNEVSSTTDNLATKEESAASKNTIPVSSTTALQEAASASVEARSESKNGVKPPFVAASKRPMVAKRITIKTASGASTEANQLILTDEIIRLLIKFGQAHGTIYIQ